MGGKRRRMMARGCRAKRKRRAFWEQKRTASAITASLFSTDAMRSLGSPSDKELGVDRDNAEQSLRCLLR